MATLAPLARRRTDGDAGERGEVQRSPGGGPRTDPTLPPYLTPSSTQSRQSPTGTATPQEAKSPATAPEARDAKKVDEKGSALGDREAGKAGVARTGDKDGASKGDAKTKGKKPGDKDQDADGDKAAAGGKKKAGRGKDSAPAAEGEGKGDGEAAKEDGDATLKKEEAPKAPPPLPPPPELGGIVPRSIPSPPPMARERMLDVLARTGKRPDAHHAEIRQRLDAIAVRARQQQDDIVREARLAAAGALAMFMTRADEVPGMVTAAEERVRAAYGGARARVNGAAAAALKELEANKDKSKKAFDATTLSMEKQLQRILATSSPQVQRLHGEQMKVVDTALAGFSRRFETEWGGSEKKMRASPARAVSNGTPSSQQLTLARLMQDMPWSEILPARVEAEKEAWPKRANEKADTVRLAINQNAQQVLSQREPLSVSILQLVNPAAVQLEEKTVHDEGEVGKARKVTTVRISTDYERAVKTVNEFHDRALKQLDQGEKGTLKEVRAVGARLEDDVRLRGQTLEATILETARELAEAYRVQMAGVNESLPAEGFLELSQLEPVLAGAAKRFDEMYAEQSAGLAATVAQTTDETDASVRAQTRSVEQLVDKQTGEAGRIAGEAADAIGDSTAAFTRSLQAPATAVTGQASPYAATASEALGARPAQVRAAVQKSLDKVKEVLEITLDSEKKKFQGFVDDMPATLRDAVVSDGLTTISDLMDRCRRAYKAMKGLGTDEAGLSASLRNLTVVQGEAMKAIWDKRIDPGETLIEWLKDDLSGDELRSALAYLSGDTAAGARYELEASMRWYGDDEDRIEAVLRDLQKEPPKGGHIGQLKKQPGWEETHQELKDSLGGTDLDVTDALLEGNVHRADALRLRDKIEKARRKGDHDAVHKLLEGVPDSEIEGVRREFAAMQLGFGPKKVDPAIISDKTAKDVFVGFVTKDRTVIDPHRARMDGGPVQRTMEITGPNRKLAVALAERVGDKGKKSEKEEQAYLDSQVAVRAARMGVEAARKGGPNREKLQKAFEYNVADIDPDLASPDPEKKRKAEEKRELQDQVRSRALRQFAQEQTGKKEVTDAEARSYAAGVVESKFDTEHGKKFGRSMVEQGYADPAASMRLAVEGRGTDEDLIKRTLKRLDKDQIAAMKRDYKSRYDEDLDERLGTNQPRKGHGTALAVMAYSPVLGAAMMAAPGGELSGDDRLEVDLLMRGRPRNDKERYELELARTEQQREETGFAGRAGMKGSQDEWLMEMGSHRMQELVRRAGGPDKAFDKDGRFVGANPTLDKASGRLRPSPEESWAFGEELKWSEFGVEAYQAGIDRMANMLATALAVIAAVVVSIAIPGAGGAIAGAIIGGLLSMGAKAAIKGGRYGWEEAVVDLAVIAVDAVTAGLTHGMGAALRGAGAAARGTATAARGAVAAAGKTTGMLARVAATGRKAGAYLATEGIENFAGSLPSAFTGQMLNEENWKNGSPFENILKGTLIEAGISTGVGLAAGTTIDLGGKAGGAIRSSLRERALKTQLMASVPSDLRHAFNDVPIIEVPGKQFDEMTGSRTGQAVTLITPDGPVIYLREGASPRALREEGLHLVQSKDPAWASKVDALSEANLARWHEMSLGEQLALYRNKVDVEIDAQQKLLLDLGDELALAGPLARRRLRQQIAEAEVALGNLQRRRVELEQFPPERVQRILDRAEGYPPYLDQPPRLFMKKADAGTKDTTTTEETGTAADPATRRVDLSGQRPGDPDYSPLAGRKDISGTVVEIGPRWVEPNGREYRLVGVVDTAGNITHVRQEIRSAHEDNRWVQRGSESQKRGQIAEAASRRMSDADVRSEPSPPPPWDTKAIPSQWDASGRGFDEVLLDFRIENGELIARVRVIEVKDYPGRWVPLDSFTAIRPPRDGGNLDANLRELDLRLRKAGLADPPAGFGLTREQRDAALDAIALVHVDLEIRHTAATDIGQRGERSALRQIEQEWQRFGAQGTVRVVEIDPAHVRAAQAESVGGETTAALADVPQAATAAERKALRDRALRRELERGLPPHLRAEAADIPIIEIPAIEFTRLTGSEHKGQAVTFITESGPVIVVKQGADPKALREEGVHVAQSREGAWAERVASLSEANLANWHTKPLPEQLSLYRTKIEIEIDAQRRLLADLGKELEIATGPARLQVEADMRAAQVTLANLSRRLEEVAAITTADLRQMTTGARTRPDYLNGPPRLFSKRSTADPGPPDVHATEEAPPSGTVTTPPVRSPDAPPAPAGTGGPAAGAPSSPQRILVVGAESEGEFAYAAEMLGRGREVTVINPERVTPAAKPYLEAGGEVVQVRIENLPAEPRFNLIREDYPYPRPLLPVVERLVQERATRLLPGGRWVVVTEGPFEEFPLVLQHAARSAGLHVEIIPLEPLHRGTPQSAYPQNPERYLFVMTRPPSRAPTAPPAGPGSGPGGPGPGGPPPGAPPGGAVPLPGLPPIRTASSPPPVPRWDADTVERLVEQRHVHEQIEAANERERLALARGDTEQAARVAEERARLRERSRELADAIAPVVLPRIAAGIDPEIHDLIDAVVRSDKAGRRIDAQQRLDSLRNIRREDKYPYYAEHPRYGYMEGFVSAEALAQNVAAVQQIRARIAKVEPDAVLAVERGGSFLTEVLQHGQAAFPPVHSLPKGPNGERIPNIEARIRSLIIQEQQSSFVIVDFYMGGKFAGELKEMIKRIRKDHPHVTIERIWIGESSGLEVSAGFEKLTRPLSKADRDVVRRDLEEGIVTTGDAIRVENGALRINLRHVVIVLPRIRGEIKSPQFVQTRVPVSMVLGDDMNTVFDPTSRNPIRIFDRHGRIVQEIPVPTRDPETGQELTTVRQIMIRLMNGVQFPRSE